MTRDPKQLFPHLFEDVRSARRIVWRPKGHSGSYDFHVFSVGERGTQLSPELVREAKAGLLQLIHPYVTYCTRIVSIVPGGNQWGLLVADALGLPLTIIRDGTSGWADEVPVQHKNSLYTRTLFFRKNMAKERIVLLDDVVSSSATAQFAIKHLTAVGATVLAVLAVILKGNAYRQITTQFNVPVHGVLQIDEQGVYIPE
jgi:adenine/guanine phosphoribosyltransferase-like PRPP-binding protein